MKLKKLFMAVALVPLFTHFIIAQEQQQQVQTMPLQNEIQVIGVYAHWITSMCAQNCENYDLAVYRLTKPLDCFELYSTHQTAYVKGIFVEVEELPTVAGPNAKVKNPDKKIQVKKLQVSEAKKTDFPAISITPSEARKYKEKNDYSLSLTFNNPVKEKLKVKIRIGSNNSFQYLELPPAGTKTLEYQMPASTGYDYPEILVVNDFFEPDSLEESITLAEKNGFLIFIKKTIRINDLINK